jgi:hypothetical protein
MGSKLSANFKNEEKREDFSLHQKKRGDCFNFENSKNSNSPKRRKNTSKDDNLHCQFKTENYQSSTRKGSDLNKIAPKPISVQNNNGKSLVRELFKYDYRSLQESLKKRSNSFQEKTFPISPRMNRLRMKSVENNFVSNIRQKFYTHNKEEFYWDLELYKRYNKSQTSNITNIISKKVWIPQPKHDHKTLFILDWDDTLFCTSYYCPSGIVRKYMLLHRKDIDNLRKVESSVLKLLELCLSKGKVYIITNSAPGWVEYSIESFYPKLKHLIKNINIISARGLYERVFPYNSKKWKIHTFLDIQKNMQLNILTNFICIGDSDIEIEASQIFSSNFTNIYLKTVKFKQNPNPEDLLHQLTLLIEKFEEIYFKRRSLTIKVEKKDKTL